MKHFLIIFLFFFANQLYAEDRCASEDDTCLIGIFPHTGTKQIRESYGAIAEDLSFELDLETRLLTSSSLSTFKEKLLGEKYDIALSGPGMYSQLKEHAYIPVARPINKMTFLIITTDRHDIMNLSDLENKLFGQLEPSSGTYLSNIALLKKANVFDKLKRTIEYKSGQACAYALASNKVDACGIAEPIYQVIQHQIPIEFRIIAKLPPVPASVYLIHKDIPQEQHSAIKNYLINRENLTEAFDFEYDVVRQYVSLVNE